MYVSSDYRIRFNGDSEANRKLANWFSDELDQNVAVGPETHVEEDATHNFVEDLWEWLEPEIENHPKASLVVEGVIDSSSTGGEYEDFRFEIHDGRIAAYRSGWYLEYCKEDFFDFEDFCECCGGEESPICTKEEFDAFESDYFYVLEDGDGRIYEEIPLRGPITSKRELFDRK